MIVKVVGKKVGSFTDKESGQVIEYGKLHCIGKFDMSDNGAEGEIITMTIRRSNLWNIM